MRPGPATAGLFALALAVHALLALQYRRDPFSSTPVADALSYHEQAQRLTREGLASEPVFHQAPLYPWLLSALYRAVSPAAQLPGAILLGAVLSSLALAGLVPLARAWGRSTGAGLAAGLLGLLHGPLVFHALKLLPTALALATQAAGLIALGLAVRAPRPRHTALAGLLWGIAALARSEVLLFVPLALGALLVAARGARARTIAAAAYTLGLAAALSPAIVHNARAGDAVLVASSLGENLFIGNQRGAAGGHLALHPQAGDLFSQRLVAERLAEQSAGRALRPSEVSRYWRDRALQEIGADPVAWVRLEVRKLARALHPGDPTDIYSFALERDEYLWLLHGLPVTPWLVLLLGALGLAVTLRNATGRTQLGPLAAWSAIQLLILLMFFVDTRLRLPFLYSLLPFAGIAVATFAGAWQRRTRRPWLLVGAAALVVASLLAGALATDPEPRDRVRLASLLSMRNRLDEALAALEPELAASRPDAFALDTAGWISQKRGDWTQAHLRYEQALATDLPAWRAAQTRSRHGRVLEQLGRFEEAAREHDLAVASTHADAGSYYERGAFRRGRGDLAGAERDFGEAARRDPRWEAPRRALAQLRSVRANDAQPSVPRIDGQPGRSQ